MHNNSSAPDSFYAELLAEDGKNSIIQANTPSSIDGLGDSAQAANGLHLGHMYSLISVHVLENGTKLVRMRNPHGTNEWKGKYCDGHASWNTIRAKDKKDLTDAKFLVNNEFDGVFFMEFSDYYAKFAKTTITFDVTGWHNAYFLKLNDDGADKDPNAEYDRIKCGGGCFVHQLIVTSKVDQTIYVTANTTDYHRRAK